MQLTLCASICVLAMNCITADNDEPVRIMSEDGIAGSCFAGGEFNDYTAVEMDTHRVSYCVPCLNEVKCSLKLAVVVSVG